MPTKVCEIRTTKDLTPAEIAMRQSKVDRFGELDRQIELMQPAVDEHAVLEAEIKSWHKDSHADKPVVETGLLYQVQMGPRTNKRTLVDKKKIFEILRRMLGLDGLIAILDFPLGAIDKTIPQSLQKGLIHEERSGYRSLKVVALKPVSPDLPKAA
jgi:hypothetical protein